MRSVVWFLIAGLIGCGDDGSGGRAMFEKRTERAGVPSASAERRRFEEAQAQLDAERRSGLKVNLPQGTATDIDPSKLSLVLDVTGDGVVAVDGVVVTEANLERVFQRAFERDHSTQVVIRASQDVAHGRVVRVMEMAKAAGLTRLAIATASPSGP